jgi:recombination protein RecT
MAQTTTPAAVRGEVPAPIVQFRRDLDAMQSQFAAALPPHIPVERFVRCLVTAVQQNPKLLMCSRQSLFNACMKAAQDGLLPDGRYGAIVPFGDEDDSGKKSSDTASWMPMVLGIRQKARNSGCLIDLYAHVVHEGDLFDVELGDNPHVKHKPSLTGGRTRPIVAAYSIAVFPGGYKSFEVITIDEIEDVRKKYSRSRRGPWSDPVAYPEMCRKTVVRLHAKSLPMSSDLDDLIRRDDHLYDMKQDGETKQQPKIEERQAPRITTVRGALDHFAREKSTEATPDDDTESPNKPAPNQSRGDVQPTQSGDGDHDTGTEESVREAGAQTKTDTAGVPPPQTQITATDARIMGQRDFRRGHQRKAVPGELRYNSAYAAAWVEGWNAEYEQSKQR